MRQPSAFAAMRRFTSTLLLTTATALVSAEVAAECPRLPDVPVLMDRPQWVSLSQDLKRQLGQCLNDSAYFALLGAALLNSGDVSEAVEMLERSLLLSSKNAGALIDYAEALYLSGDSDAAIRINKRLLARSDTPSPIRKLLVARNRLWNSERVDWLTRLTVLGGYHNNLNGVADISELLITTDTGDLLLSVDEDSRPIEGGFSTGRLSLQRFSVAPSRRSNFSMSVQNRFSKLEQYDTGELNLGYGLALETDSGEHRFDVDLGYVTYGGNGLYWTAAGEYARYWTLSRSCSPYTRLQSEVLRFNELTIMDEWSSLGAVGLRCEKGGSFVSLDVGYAYNAALDHRPGDDRQGPEVSFKWQYVLKSGLLYSQVGWGNFEDLEGYSPLLSQGEIRSNEVWSASMQYIHPITRFVSFQMGVYYRDQESNIAIFDTQSKSAHMGVSVAF